MDFIYNLSVVAKAAAQRTVMIKLLFRMNFFRAFRWPLEAMWIFKSLKLFVNEKDLGKHQELEGCGTGDQ